MACYSSFILLLAAILLFSLASANVDETCKAVNTANLAVEYDFCASSLRMNRNSEKADVKGLALIGAELCFNNVTGLTRKVDNMIAKGNYPQKTIEILKFCRKNIFPDLIRMSNRAFKAVQSGNYAGALSTIGDIYDQAEDCNYNFYEADVGDVIGIDEDNFQKLAALAAVLIRRVK